MSKSKPKNGKPSSQDYMNLLYTDSESDTVPDLRLPPLKGKKPKRRSTTQRQSEESNLCSPWVILKVVIVSVILCSIVGLGVVTYWSLQQITELKDKINALTYNELEENHQEMNPVLFLVQGKTRPLLPNSGSVPMRIQRRLLRSHLNHRLKGAKAIVYRRKRDRWPNQGCCSTCYTLTCVLVVASCLLACATLIWMHLELKRNFNELKDRMEQVENKNAGTPEEFEALKMKLMSVNSSVAEIRSGKYGLDALNTSIVQIKKQITSLQATTSKLQQSDQSTDSTDKEHKALADTVATIGSDLNTAQSGITSVKAKQTEFASQLEALGNRLIAVENPGGREGGASVAPASTDVQKLLTQINATFTQSISKVVTDVNKLQTHMDAVDKFTQTMQDQMRNLTMQVSNVTQAHSQWQGSNSKVTDPRAEDEPTQPVTTEALHELQNRMEHLQDSLEKIQTDHSNLTQAVDTSTDTAALANVMQKLKEDQGDFLLFRTEVFHDITSLNTSMATVNESVGSLNKDVADLFAKMGVAMTEISNVTSVVEGLTDFLQSQKENKTANAVAEGAGSKAEEKGGVTDNAQTLKTTLPESKQTTTTHQEQLNKSTTTPQSKKSEY